MNGWRPRAAAAAASLTLLLAAGCSSSRQAAPAESTTPPATTRDRAATRDDVTSRVIVVVEENHSFEQTIGSPAAPFINRLAAYGTLLIHYYAVTHPSLPNYVALPSGRTPIRSDCRACTFAGPTLVDQLEAQHISWAAYYQVCPGPAPPWPASAPTPRRSIRSCTPPTCGTTPPAATGSCRSAAFTPTWPSAGCPP
jgi:hypothetical protein